MQRFLDTCGEPRSKKKAVAQEPKLMISPVKFDARGNKFSVAGGGGLTTSFAVPQMRSRPQPEVSAVGVRRSSDPTGGRHTNNDFSGGVSIGGLGVGKRHSYATSGVSSRGLTNTKTNVPLPTNIPENETDYTSNASRHQFRTRERRTEWTTTDDGNAAVTFNEGFLEFQNRTTPVVRRARTASDVTAAKIQLSIGGGGGVASGGGGGAGAANVTNSATGSGAAEEPDSIAKQITKMQEDIRNLRGSMALGIRKSDKFGAEPTFGRTRSNTEGANVNAYNRSSYGAGTPVVDMGVTFNVEVSHTQAASSRGKQERFVEPYSKSTGSSTSKPAEPSTSSFRTRESLFSVGVGMGLTANFGAVGDTASETTDTGPPVVSTLKWEKSKIKAVAEPKGIESTNLARAAAALQFSLPQKRLQQMIAISNAPMRETVARDAANTNRETMNNGNPRSSLNNTVPSRTGDTSSGIGTSAPTFGNGFSEAFPSAGQILGGSSVASNDGSTTSKRKPNLARNADKKREEKVQQYKKSLTLAQKMNLTEKPAEPLMAREWIVFSRAKIELFKRDVDHKCPICFQQFISTHDHNPKANNPPPHCEEVGISKTKSERNKAMTTTSINVYSTKAVGRTPIILHPCGHIYHQRCLASYEHFKGERSCPLCRGEYTDCAPFGTIDLFKHMGATKFQRLYRGYKIRAQFLYPLLTKADTPILWGRTRGMILRRQREKLMGENEIENLDDFFAEIDGDVGRARDMLNKVVISEDGNSISEKPEKEEVVGQDRWMWAKEQCLSRGFPKSECPICFMEFKGHGGAVALLDCGHCFHCKCVESFESFQTAKTELKCPVCRHGPYEKKIWKFVAKKAST